MTSQSREGFDSVFGASRGGFGQSNVDKAASAFLQTLVGGPDELQTRTINTLIDDTGYGNQWTMVVIITALLQAGKTVSVISCTDDFITLYKQQDNAPALTYYRNATLKEIVEGNILLSTAVPSDFVFIDAVDDITFGGYPNHDNEVLLTSLRKHAQSTGKTVFITIREYTITYDAMVRTTGKSALVIRTAHTDIEDTSTSSMVVAVQGHKDSSRAHHVFNHRTRQAKAAS